MKTAIACPDDDGRHGHPVDGLDRLQEEVQELAEQLDELELKFAIIVHKASRGFFQGLH